MYQGDVLLTGRFDAHRSYTSDQLDGVASSQLLAGDAVLSRTVSVGVTCPLT